MKLSFFGKLIVAVGCLFFASVITWLVINALTLEMYNWSVPAIAISGSLFLILVGLGIACNLNAYTTKIHIKKFICQTECESMEYLGCNKHSCKHARPHTPTAECKNIGCVQIQRRLN